MVSAGREDWIEALDDEGQRSLDEVADWGPAEDWSDWDHQTAV